MAAPSLQMSGEEVGEFITREFPQAQFAQSFEVISLVEGEVTMRFMPRDAHLRPGGTVSGPAMMSLADISAYVLLLAHLGPVALAVTTNLNINFLNKPEMRPILGTASFLKFGKRLVVTEHAITDQQDGTLLAHATATYSIPPLRA